MNQDPILVRWDFWGFHLFRSPEVSLFLWLLGSVFRLLTFRSRISFHIQVTGFQDSVLLPSSCFFFLFFIGARSVLQFLVTRFCASCWRCSRLQEDLADAVVICKVWGLAIALWLLVVQSGVNKWSLHLLTNPNPVYSHASNSWQYQSIHNVNRKVWIEKTTSLYFIASL